MKQDLVKMEVTESEYHAIMQERARIRQIRKDNNKHAYCLIIAAKFHFYIQRNYRDKAYYFQKVFSEFYKGKNYKEVEREVEYILMAMNRRKL